MSKEQTNKLTNKQSDEVRTEMSLANDTISRQAAIDAAKCGALSAAMVYGRTDEGSTALYETVKAIKAVPSAHTEIIYCRDCKWHGYNECFHRLGLIAAFDNNYCSYAERREE